jgi:hypothetical protein
MCVPLNSASGMVNNSRWKWMQGETGRYAVVHDFIDFILTPLINTPAKIDGIQRPVINTSDVLKPNLPHKT